MTRTGPALGRDLRARRTAPWFAAATAMAAYCLAMSVHGTYPFGGRSRAVNDLGNQFVPFHARLWDLMHGEAHGDLFFNWASGYGTPFLADFFTYLMNPFSWLVGIFPRHSVEFPVFLVTLFSVGLAAALMTVFLGRLHEGSPWLRALLSVGFGLSAWMISDGFSDPMWMWGLVALPLLGIAYDWCLGRRRWVSGSLLVTVCWAGNFYTAAMATIGMALVLLVRVLLDERPVAERLRVVARAASMTGVGILLAAPVLTVGLKASKLSQPAPEAVYQGPPAPLDYLAHLIPGGLVGRVPHISVGMLALLLVATYPFIRRVPRRERVAWLALVALMAGSLVWKPTILLWHGLAMPNGSPYRASIALTAVLVCVAWLALARRPRVPELLGGGALVLLLVVSVSTTAYMTTGPWVLAAGGLVLLGLLLALDRFRGDRRVRRGLTVALAGAVFLSSSYTVLSTTRIRDAIEWWKPKRTFDSQALAAYGQLKAVDAWPASRTDPGPHSFASNDPMLLAGQGGGYYSSYLPAATADALHRLGAGWYIQGRHTRSFNDPVGRAVMGVSTYLEPDAGPDGFVRRSALAPPVVTLRPAGTPLDGTVRDVSLFSRQERLLGARVYEVPTLARSGGGDSQPVPGRGWPLGADGAEGAGGTDGGGAAGGAGAAGGVGRPGRTGTDGAGRTGTDGASGAGRAGPGAGTTFTAVCAPGSEAYWYAPWLRGRVDALGTTLRPAGKYPMTSNPLYRLGTVPADGRVAVRVHSAQRQYIPESPVGCLDRAALDRTVRQLRATGPDRVDASGHAVGAAFAPGTAGTAVLSVPAVPGWLCAVDGGPARVPRTLGGLIAVELGDSASRLACSYRTPGLRLGLAASGAAAALLLAVTAAHLLRTRTARTSRSSRTSDPSRRPRSSFRSQRS
ncbi:YfhO family protein [Streptomyces sp. NPDC057426]|uniref:YfhO family protein n=1 Tax=Streptomyces sp. NPDC057426 TaxID=3346128 RepID=UPI0036AA32FA